MANATGKAGQWGKRSEPEGGFDGGGSLAENAEDSLLRMRSSAGDGECLLDNLPLELHAELFSWLDARTRACVALCSSHLARRMRLVRRIEAGKLLEGGQLRVQACAEQRRSGQWLKSRADGVARTRGWQNLSLEFCEFDAGGLQALEAIGFEAGNRFLHIDGLQCHQAVLEGVARAPGWQSLTTSYSRHQLQSGLDALANAVVPGDPEVRRELSLRIFDCEKKLAFQFPENLRLQRLDLVELYMDQLIDPDEFLPCFNEEQFLQSLEILVDESVADAAVVFKTIGKHFTDLRYFRLVSYKPFGIEPGVWAEFLLHHTKLESLDLNHANFSLLGEALDFSQLKVRNLTLGEFHLADPGEKFERWIKENRQLVSLEIELAESALADNEPAKLQVRDRLLEAMAANSSLSDLKLKGEAWIVGGDDNQPCDSFLSLMDTIISHPKLTALQIPAFDIRSLDDLLNGAVWLRKSVLMEKLETLERLQPELRLTLGEFELETVRYKTSINGSDAQAMQALQGWSVINRAPSPGQALEFKIVMPIWGAGAFRRFIKFCALRPDRQQRYLISLARQGSLVDGSLKIVRVGDRAVG